MKVIKKKINLIFLKENLKWIIKMFIKDFYQKKNYKNYNKVDYKEIKFINKVKLILNKVYNKMIKFCLKFVLYQ